MNKSRKVFTWSIYEKGFDRRDQPVTPEGTFLKLATSFETTMDKEEYFRLNPEMRPARRRTVKKSVKKKR